MKEIVKHVSVVNDGFTKMKKSALDRITPVEERYIKKMEAKGWQLNGVYEGNKLSRFEATIKMFKETN